MTNNEINKKILETFKFSNYLKNINESDYSWWYTNRGNLDFLYYELKLDKAKRIYIFNQKITEINFKDNKYINFSFNYKNSKTIYKKSIELTKIIYNDGNIAILGNMEIIDDYDIFIFENSELINKLEMLMVI